MSTSKRRAENVSFCAETVPADQAPAGDDGRDARGRFTAGNAGGPGNPFARRVAELRKVLLETVTDEELRIVAGQLMVKAKMGDLAATKLLFQYVLGKPAATVDPDALDLHELELYRRGPSPKDAQEVTCERLPAAAVAEVLRVEMPCLGAQFKDTAAREILGIGPDGEMLDDEDGAESAEREEDDEEEALAEDSRTRQGRSAKVTAGAGPRPVAAPSPNGETDADRRRRATPPSTNGPSFKDKPPRPTSGNGDNGGRLPDSPRPQQRPPLGM